MRGYTRVGLDPKAIIDQFTDPPPPKPDEPPPRAPDDPPDDESGGTGTAMVLEEGKLGRKEARLKDPNLKELPTVRIGPPKRYAEDPSREYTIVGEVWSPLDPEIAVIVPTSLKNRSTISRSRPSSGSSAVDRRAPAEPRVDARVAA